VTAEFIWPDMPSAQHETQAWRKPGIEPTLSDALAEPIVQALMQRDGVSRTALESVIAHAQGRLRRCNRPGSPLTYDYERIMMTSMDFKNGAAPARRRRA
jgi:hypothetical protein